MKTNVLIIGAGGVAHVAAHKCAQYSHVLGDLHLASRSVAKCEAIIRSVRAKGSLRGSARLIAHPLDALDVDHTVALIRATGCRIVVNLGSPMVNMSVLSACLATGAAYIDTAIHEDPLRVCEPPPWYANYEWRRRAQCEQAGVTAILGAGFDPGVVNAYARLAQDEYFDAIDAIDIVDVNAGNHGRYFATNFDPETNFREFTGTAWTWQDNRWVANQMFEVRKDWELPVVGSRATYLCGHDEIHSLSQTLRVPTVRFWMGFGEHYINVFTVLRNLGLLSEQPVVTAEGLEVVPLKVVKAVLPDPASLAAGYTGKTVIGDFVRGTRDGAAREIFLYNVSDHEQAYREVGSQAISYTAGVPAAAAAVLVATGEWDAHRMLNVEELPPRPFLGLLDQMGLPTRIRHAGHDSALRFDAPLPPPATTEAAAMPTR